MNTNSNRAAALATFETAAAAVAAYCLDEAAIAALGAAYEPIETIDERPDPGTLYTAEPIPSLRALRDARDAADHAYSVACEVSAQRHDAVTTALAGYQDAVEAYTAAVVAASNARDAAQAASEAYDASLAAERAALDARIEANRPAARLAVERMLASEGDEFLPTGLSVLWAQPIQ